ncbi:hypothetical protein OIO90_000394 [Microbotryomycetes sp. JL221]|nr:hypothetical protein OIO90_000394 [Microbotryomycetes sp. JL221]
MVKMVAFVIAFATSFASLVAAQGVSGAASIFGPSAINCTLEGSDCGKYDLQKKTCEQQQSLWTPQQFNECICGQDYLGWIAGCAECINGLVGVDPGTADLIQGISEDTSSSIPSATTRIINGESGSDGPTATGAAASEPSSTAPPDSAAGNNHVKLGVLGFAIVAATFAVGL